jgi:hypothetical protein
VNSFPHPTISILPKSQHLFLMNVFFSYHNVSCNVLKCIQSNHSSHVQVDLLMELLKTMWSFKGFRLVLLVWLSSPMRFDFILEQVQIQIPFFALIILCAPWRFRTPSSWPSKCRPKPHWLELSLKPCIFSFWFCHLIYWHERFNAKLALVLD